MHIASLVGKNDHKLVQANSRYQHDKKGFKKLEPWTTGNIEFCYELRATDTYTKNITPQQILSVK